MTPRRDLIFRVFVSSTFSDLVEERNALQAKGGPFDHLRAYCQERGARFQAIDLRWGVSEEAALDQQTMAICRQELAHCQEVSPRPNFIILLGDRYGWRPLPARLEAGEFEELLGAIPKPERKLLTTGQNVPAWREGAQAGRNGWYRKDFNAVPVEYVLQPRTTDFHDGASNEDRRRLRKQERDDWTRIEHGIRSLMLGAIGRLNWPSDDPRRDKYEASATHQEIQAGALQAEDPQNHVFCYFREIEGLPADETAASYRDMIGSAVDEEYQGRLAALKGHLAGDDQRRGLLSPEHVHRYRACWRDGAPEMERRNLCADVERDLRRVIDRELASFRQKPARDREREAHREFAAERCRHFVGRNELRKRIQAYIEADDMRPLVIHGQSGSGKTALMAQAIADCATGNPGWRTVSRFVGATPGSSDLRSLLTDLCWELGLSEIPQDMSTLGQAFRTHLAMQQAGDEAGSSPPREVIPGKVVLFIDALDQLNPTDHARMLYWMPRELKPNVKLVVSVLESRSADPETPGDVGGSAFRPGEDPFDMARRIWPQSMLEIGALDPTSGRELLDAWLAESSRTLQEPQRRHILDRFSRCPLPLYLKLATQQAQQWRSWLGVPFELGTTVEDILDQMLARLERPECHGEAFVRQSLSYIALGKNGLTEDELLGALSADPEVMANFFTRSPESPQNIDRLPVVVWSRLFADMAPYMMQRRADGTVVLDFYHRQVREAVRRRYLASEEARAGVHQHLAEYFHKQDYWAEPHEAQRARANRLPATPRPANVRKVVELPYHRLEAAKLRGKDDPNSPYWDAVADLLTDWLFLEAKTEADPGFKEQASVGPLPNIGDIKP